MPVGHKKERAKARKNEPRQKDRDTVLMILSAAFLAGGVLGCLLLGKLSGESYLSGFFQSVAQEPVTPSLWRAVWTVLRWPMAAVALSLLPLVGLTLPLLFFLRGFFLSYGIVALIQGMGASGLLCAGVVFGPACVLAVPALFILGTAGMLRKTQPKSGKLLRRGLACLPCLALCVFLDQRVVPKLLTVLAKGILAVAE